MANPMTCLLVIFQKELVRKHKKGIFLHNVLPWVNPLQLVPMYLKPPVITIIIRFTQLGLCVVFFFLLLFSQKGIFQQR